MSYCASPNTTQKVTGEIEIVNEKGLHTRPSTELVKCTSRFRSAITLTYLDLTVNGKSLLGILMLAAANGARIRVDIEGEDASEALAALTELAKNGFNTPY